MALPLVNSLEGGSNGTTITAGNSGGASGNAFDVFTVATGITLRYSSAQSAHGGLSMEVATGATGTTAWCGWQTALGSQTDLYGRIYLRLSAAPTANDAIVRFVNGATVLGFLQITTARILRLANTASTVIATFTNAIPLNQWVRIEFHLTFPASATGTAEVRLYLSADSAAPTETQGPLAATQNFGSLACSSVRFGWSNGVANQVSAFLDDIGVSTTWLGIATGPKLDTLSTDFNSIPAFFDANFGGPSVSGGQGILPCISVYSGFQTSKHYDLTGSAVSLQVVTNPGTTGTREFTVSLDLDANNRVLMFDSGGTFTARLRQAGVNTDISLGTYSPTTHAWWRIRESAGTIFWDTSVDGITWTNRASHTYTVAITALTLQISCGYFGAETSPPSAVIDNFNLAAVSQAVGLVFTDLGAITQSRQLVSNDFAAVTKSVGLVFNDQAAVTQTRALVSNDRAAVGVTRQALWTDLVAITQTRALVSSDLAAVSQSVEVLFAELGAVAQTRELVFSDRAVVDQTRELLFGAEGEVTVSCSPQWTVRCLVALALTLRFADLAEVGAVDLRLRWTDDASVGTTRTLRWSVLFTIPPPQGHVGLWNGAGLVGISDEDDRITSGTQTRLISGATAGVS